MSYSLHDITHDIWYSLNFELRADNRVVESSGEL